MVISTLVEKVLEGIVEAASRSSREEVIEGVKEWLEDKGYYVAYGDVELKKLALEETDLEEPVDEDR